MFHDHIWQAMGMKEGEILCDKCAWDRLLTKCPFNEGFWEKLWS